MSYESILGMHKLYTFMNNAMISDLQNKQNSGRSAKVSFGGLAETG